MKKETLKQIISQIKKYELTDTFSDIESFKSWLSKLNNIEINNLLSLDIDLKETTNIKKILLNKNLLNCEDYKQKVYALSTLKNCEGCCHLLSDICKPNFLKSKNFYKDIEMLSKADTARYGLWILGEDNFINSPYHDEDLKLLVESRDTNKNRNLNYVVQENLAEVARNINSIKSPYHRNDMKLIATAGSKNTQTTGPWAEYYLKELATNKVSLGDKYHLENMQILATNPKSIEMLYIIMTEPKVIKGKNYRKEIETMVNAKSKIIAKALYYYIFNPSRKFLCDMNYLDYYGEYHNIKDIDISDRDLIAGSNDPDYLNNLIKINKFDDKLVMYYVGILMNIYFINSPYKKFDLELLETIKDKSIFMDLYILMTNEDSLKSAHHKKDAVIISQTQEKENRKLLVKKATDNVALNSQNHDYDMEYISKLDLKSLSLKIYKEISYYLFTKKGIEDPRHKEKLEKLLNGILVERKDCVTSYLEDLENELENITFDSQITEENKNTNFKSKILSLFQRKK